MNLSNVILQYCQPTAKVESEMKSWYELLEKNGSCVHHIAFAVDNMEETVERFRAVGIDPVFMFDLEKGSCKNVKAGVRQAYMINTMEKLGFYLALTENTK